MICNKHFSKYQHSQSVVQPDTQGVNGVVIPNLYRQHALNQKADFSSSNSKKGCYFHKTIYTSSIYIIHVLQSTFGFSDCSAVI